MESGGLVVPAGETELLAELMHLRSEPTMTGERISGHPHDDLAMSLAMALGPLQDRQRGGDSWRCRIAELSRGPVPPASLPAALGSAQKITAGSGAEVPRRPVWQSVMGGDLTVPEDLDHDRRESPALIRAREAVAAAMSADREEA